MAKKRRQITMEGMGDSAAKASTPEPVEKVETFEGMTVVYRDSRKLKSHPLQKEYFGMLEDDLMDIFPSILASGVKQPLEICVLPNGEEQINAGHRRQAASIKAGSINPDRYMVPCIVYENMTEAQAEEDFITTNFFRPIPQMIKAKMIQREKEIISEKIKSGELQGKTSEFLAKKLGVSDSTVKRLNKMMKLIPELQDLATRNIITQDQALKLFNKSEEEQREFYEIFHEGVKNMTTEEVKKAADELSAENSELKENLRKAQEQVKRERQTLNEQINNLRGKVTEMEVELGESDSEELKRLLEQAQRELDEKEKALEQAEKNGSEKQIETLRKQIEEEKQKEIEAAQNEADEARKNAEKFEQLYEDAKNFDVTQTPEYQQLKKQADESQELKRKQDSIEIIKDAEAMLSTVSGMLDTTFPNLQMVLDTAASLELHAEISEPLKRLLEVVDKYRDTITSVSEDSKSKTA
jgi:ParB-like chromosome segregation protein Spo0J